MQGKLNSNKSRKCKKMDFKKNLYIVKHRPFKYEFKINKFKESPISTPEQRIQGRLSGVHLSVQGKGELPENEDCVVLRIRKYLDTRLLKYWEESDSPFLICTCILNIMDVQGHEKFPRTLTFKSDSKCSDVCEERYIRRSCILNDASEYLQCNNTLTVIVRGVLDEWDDLPRTSHWFPSKYSDRFRIKQLENGMKVYIPHRSIYADYLLTYSSVFQKMLNAPLREGKQKCIPLQNEELPAFMCMLFFIENKKLLLYEATIFDLYKIAHMYDIPIVLEKCRECIEKYLPKSASAILEFATFYNDAKLKRTAEYYIERPPHETQESNDNLETENELDEDFVCDTLPVCSNLIKTKEDFETHLRNLWEKITSEITHEAVDYIPEVEWRTEPEEFDFYQ